MHELTDVTSGLRLPEGPIAMSDGSVIVVDVCAATLINGGITVVSPDGSSMTHVATGDPLATIICFGEHRGLRLNYL
ncbi:MAG: hypothetical protein ABI894_04030 [Ilumatobacteraceae bacterium]